ncbi:hypothetical protein SLEP1_g38300 [Rubroshorea leprosula]|uniref:DUF4283 domain-containing protein n=1 Tax=Rubroshorea leprosula TaxID=152421 RepID=A0AAV5KXL1_9ROSI|nr:hypothetical protein SLEP1_g38300 [Rubroshorea leprosula]
MGGRGRKKKDAPLKGGRSKEVTGTKSVENDAKNSSIEDAVKEQVEVVKLVARDLELMGLVVEEVEEGKREGKRVVGLDTQSPESPAKLLIGTNGASSSGVKTETPRVRWIDLVDGEKDEVLTQPLRKLVKSWSSVVQGNRDIRKGWELQYVKPQNPSGVVVITKDEWYQGSKVWENALVGYVLGCKPHFKDMANYANNRWKEFQVPKVFFLRNGVFLFDFADGEANLGKMASYLGVPIATDALIAKRQRVSFARMLVEVEIMEELPQVERNYKAKTKKMWVVKGSMEQKQLIKPSMQQADAAMIPAFARSAGSSLSCKIDSIKRNNIAEFPFNFSMEKQNEQYED